MLEKPRHLDSIICQALKTHYEIDLSSLTFLPIGADTDASLYKGETHDQTSYFIKVKHTHQPDLSVEIVELLKGAGIKEVISPIKSKEGNSTQPVQDFTLIVYPFVQGEDGFTRPLTADQWIQLGKALRKIHDLKVPPSIQSHLRKETSAGKWRDTLRSMFHHIETDVSGDEIALKMQKFMKKNRGDLRRLVDRAEQLGEKLQEECLPCVLCHSDLHGGNVLISKNSEIYIVDWDQPILAPKERDLMFIGGGVGNVWNKPDEENHFYKGYGKVKVNLTALTYYRYERIVEDAAIYCRELLLKTEGGKNRQEMYQHFIAQFASNGVVSIAFQSDKNLSNS